MSRRGAAKSEPRTLALPVHAVTLRWGDAVVRRHRCLEADPIEAALSVSPALGFVSHVVEALPINVTVEVSEAQEGANAVLLANVSSLQVTVAQADGLQHHVMAASMIEVSLSLAPALEPNRGRRDPSSWLPPIAAQAMRTRFPSE